MELYGGWEQQSVMKVTRFCICGHLISGGAGLTF
jgi:hypothetical protein